MSPAKPRRGIGSLETGLRVLAALGDAGRATTLSDVARRSGLSPSAAHRYLASLVAAGFATQPQGGSLYDLDSATLRIGLAALSRIAPLDRADAALRTMVEATGRTAMISVWGDAGPTVVRWIAGTPPVLTTLSLGSVLPLLRSATGRVFLAYGDAPAMDAEAARALATDRAGTSPDIAALRAAVRTERLARVEGELIPGLRALAAPVFDAGGRLALVATSIATAATDPAGDPLAADALLDACRTATEAVGGTWP
ncbi:IclR family transcriptional regulator [Roseomonas sp. CCTCC AB2023176]|uniref:IclR family transcriptional regulator n=1 Tax=Roseomonas sp. CCTCC AB2023176 TaxID=3342640 RepID=UPI0035D7CE82